MRDVQEDFRVDPRVLEATGLRIERDGEVLLDVGHLRLENEGPTLILGPNGAGKSLLLRCLHGLVRPDSGVIGQGGRILDVSVRTRQAMVFQSPVLLRRSVAENLAFIFRRRGMGRSERNARIAELLEIGGLREKARQWARSLSGGEAQRLAMLRALACDPVLLFLDEPTSALDPAATKTVEALLQTVHARGVRIVMVTHDVGQARRLASDVLMMHRGQIMEHTEAGEFFRRPQSRAARCFLKGKLVW